MCVRACVCLCVRCRSCGQKTDAQCHLAITDDGQIVWIQHYSNNLIFWHLPAAREQISTEVRPVKWRKCIVNRNFERERELWERQDFDDVPDNKCIEHRNIRTTVLGIFSVVLWFCSHNKMKFIKIARNSFRMQVKLSWTEMAISSWVCKGNRMNEKKLRLFSNAMTHFWIFSQQNIQSTPPPSKYCMHIMASKVQLISCNCIAVWFICNLLTLFTYECFHSVDV